ncbi:OmpL47-type beta-barrel domain-containing protein [Paenibacillus thalictri]|uniref:Bacterial Ig-like domain-containing protein n=1 Tax=Paenibacillus thalictri TaxID=2527873 RepID=A0A4Q9DGU9_9BACL|nr:hypothetical protein [Paenibacillus thalictri]TBL68561.1 hypothetical protein EYB31_37825 [Paenibacillus thalictri]
MNKISLWPMIGSLLLVFLAACFISDKAAAEPQTLTISGATGSPGATDPYTEFSLDNGQTWSPAYLYGEHPWGVIPGTNSWINCGPSGTDYCIGQSVLYRVQFNVPAPFTNPQIAFEVKADNYADIWLNGTSAGHIESSGVISGDATVNNAVYAGVNEARILLTDSGGWVGLNFKITVQVDAPFPPTLADTIPPTTTDDAPANWVNHNVDVRLTAADNTNGSVVAATYYKVNNGAIQNGQIVSLSAEGIHTVNYWSVDHAGNVETTRTATVKIDKTAPVTTDNAPAHWVNNAVTVTLQVYDTGAGAAATYYVLDGGAQQTGTAIELSTEGVHTIDYWTVDQAGNAETPHRKSVIVKFIPMNNGEFRIDDIVKLLDQGTVQQKDMNFDGIFDVRDLEIMLIGVTPVVIR